MARGGEATVNIDIAQFSASRLVEELAAVPEAAKPIVHRPRIPPLLEYVLGNDHVARLTSAPKELTGSLVIGAEGVHVNQRVDGISVVEGDQVQRRRESVSAEHP